MRLLDLFCGAGGAAMGYSRAGFDVVGVDHKAQPRYPFEFIKADALEYVAEHGQEYDAIYASPPCQAYSVMSREENNHPDLYIPTREAVQATSKPWIIENVMNAPYNDRYMLCGSMFALLVRRHRNFETSWVIPYRLRCNHKKQGRPITVTGNGGGDTAHSRKGVKEEWPQYMGMPWATPAEVTQAIPPAYTFFIGKALMAVVEAKG